MNIFPINYDLTFVPDLSKFIFNGTEIITVNCPKPTNVISMHCAEIKIKSCIVKNNNKAIKTILKLNPKKEELNIKLSKKIKGKSVIEINFSGILNEKLLGFYRSQYKQGKKIKYLATTQFEAADARRAFPCWDEPEYKATFDISIIADSKFTAISNMPVESKKKIKNKTLYKFAKTPVMSTYLVYLGVGEFEYLSSKTGKTQIRVVTTKGNKSKGLFSLSLGKRLLKSYEDYFGIKYPLPKLDLIAIPDFASGAMENWGAITFRETLLLYDPKNSSTKTKQYIAEVISHEIAHQWFGNLVTMKWWNDLWLNESFATFMATKFVDKFYPEWELWDQFVEEDMNTAMGIDALNSTHPIDVKVNSPAEIREIFDAISYDKGGCVLRMLENYTGEAKFQSGLKQYLSKHKYQNATGNDLWNEISKTSKMPVNKMVQTWLKQPGFPIVEISQNGDTLDIYQSRFLMEQKKSKEKWLIPISIGLTKESTHKLISKKSTKIKISKSQLGFVANLGRKGFYRVKYDDDLLLNLKLLVGENKVNPIDRWAIQNDLFALCVAGKEKLRNYFDFTDAYYNEDTYLAKTNVVNNLNFVYLLTFWEDFTEDIKKYTINYLRKLSSDLGWDKRKGEKHTDSLLRSFVIFALGKMGDEQILSNAETRFMKFLKSPTSLDPDMRETVYSLVAWNGDSKTFSKLIQLYKKTTSMEEKLRFLSALCLFRDEKLLKKTLDFSQSKYVRSQNMSLSIIKIASNPYGRKILWPWLQKNWNRLGKKIGLENPLFDRIVASISLMADDSMEHEIRVFFKRNPTPGTERTQEQMLEKIRIHSKFLRQIRKEFKN